MSTRGASYIEMSGKEAFLAIGLVFLVIISVALIQAGIISNPLTLGLIVTLTVVLIFIGHVMVSRGVLSKSGISLWYILVFGILMLIYGGIRAGYIPLSFLVAGASIDEIAITNAMLYTVILVTVFALVAVAFVAFKRNRKY